MGRITLRPLDPQNPDDAIVLYALLLERPGYARISSIEDPTFDDHVAFVTRHPYRLWYMIDLTIGGLPLPIGSIYATNQNEIGIAVKSAYQGNGCGPEALQLFLAMHRPLPAIPGTRAAQWLANINPLNERSRAMFEDFGFKLIQQTFALPSPEEREHD